MSDNTEQQMTINEISEQVSTFRDAVQEARRNSLRHSNDAPQLIEMIAMLEEKAPSLEGMLLPPFMKASIRSALKPIMDMAAQYGDTRYFPKMMDALNAGHFKRMVKLGWLGYLNYIRMSRGGEPSFDSVRRYVKDVYNDDIADPNGHTAFLPAREPALEEIWKMVDRMEEQGLATVRETVKVKDPDGEYRELSLITISDVV